MESSEGVRQSCLFFCSWDHIVPSLTGRVLLGLWLFTPAAQKSQIEIEAVIVAQGRESQKAPEGTRAGRRLAMCEWSRALHISVQLLSLVQGTKSGLGILKPRFQFWLGDLGHIS